MQYSYIESTWGAVGGSYKRIRGKRYVTDIMDAGILFCILNTLILTGTRRRLTWFGGV